jgi:hypothetical protein
MTKSTMTSKCSSIAAHFKDLVDVPVQYKAHSPMHHVQGYTRSHWTLPSGNYLLRIALAAARATANKATMNKCTHFAGYFDGFSGAPVQYRAHRPIKEVQGFTKSHWMPPLGKYCSQ